MRASALALALLAGVVASAGCVVHAGAEPAGLDHMPPGMLLQLGRDVRQEAESGRLSRSETQAAYDEALRLFAATLRADPMEYRAHYYAGRILERRSDWESAESAYRAALQIEVRHARSWMALGRTLYRQRRYHEAINAFERAREHDGGNTGALFGLGLTLAKLDHHDEAIEVLEVFLRTADEGVTDKMRREAEVALARAYHARARR